jgi:protein CpxP
LAICGAALSTAPMLAQGGGGRMMMTPEQQTDAVDKAVTLTADQKTKVLAIYTADAKKMADLRASQDPDMRTKMMTMRTDEQTQIKAVLSDDQKPKYDAFLAAQPRGGRGGGGAPPAGPPPQL